jgi:hypothetical protein
MRALCVEPSVPTKPCSSSDTSFSSNRHSSSNSISSRHSSSMCTNTLPYPITKLLPLPHQHGFAIMAEVYRTAMSPMGWNTWQQHHGRTHGFSNSLFSPPPSLQTLCPVRA